MVNSGENDIFRLACVAFEWHVSQKGSDKVAFVLTDDGMIPYSPNVAFPDCRIFQLGEMLNLFPKGADIIERSMLNLSRIVDHPFDTIQWEGGVLSYAVFTPQDRLSAFVDGLQAYGYLTHTKHDSFDIGIIVLPKGWEKIKEWERKENLLDVQTDRKAESMTEYPEKYWHCRVRKVQQKQDVRVSDLTFSELQAKVIAPFKANRKFSVAGQVVSAGEIDEIQVVHTPHGDKFNMEWFYDKLRQANQGSNVISFATYPGPCYSEEAKDYTNELLFSEGQGGTKENSEINSNLTGSDVFVVHGHDEALRGQVCLLLEKLDLNPIVLHEQADRGRTVIQKFEDHSDVAYAVVLITPDDEGGIAGSQELTPRARQNVIFELGFFYGKLGRKNVCAILKKGVEFPSDINGVIYKPADPNGAWKLELARELKAAGLSVDLNKLG